MVYLSRMNNKRYIILVEFHIVILISKNSMTSLTRYIVPLELKKGQKGDSPKMSRKLESQTVVDGQEVQFIVKVEGAPRPNITWFRQTAIIKPSEEFQVSLLI